MTKGEKIRNLRDRIGKSQVEMAELIGVSKQTLYKYENDIITNIPSDKIEAIASITHTTPAYIMGWDAPVASQRVLTPDEAVLLQDYQKLNSVGKGKIRDYANDLTEQDRYKQDTGSLEDIAM